MIRFSNHLILITCIFFSILSYDAVAQPDSSAAGLYFDEDYLTKPFGLNQDRNYTMGIGLFYGNNKWGREFIFWPLHKINKAFGYKILTKTSGLHILKLTNAAYTPETISAYEVIPDDRPYASVTSLQTGFSAFKTNRQRLTGQFSAGFLASSLGRWFQTKVHTVLGGNVIPRGWPNQISNNFEPTLLYTFQHDYLLSKTKEDPFWGIEAKHGFRYMLGYYTGVNYFIQFRTGKLNPANWAADVNNLQENQAKVAKGRRRPELYAFGALRPQFMLYNALLNGQFRKSVYTLDFNEMRHTVMEFDTGLGFTIPDCIQKTWNLKLRFSGRSPEFKFPTRSPRWHYWGGLEIAANF